MEQRQISINTVFQAYLTHHHLTPLEVSITSQVRYSTVWNILHNKPIKPAHAALVRRGLQRMTGIPYTAPIERLPQEEQRGAVHHAK
jgi:hypothetical protein